MSIRVIDLGTKTGGALSAFRKHHGKHFPRADVRPDECLGVDRKDKYRREVERKGYAFRVADVVADFDWPIADYYLAFDFLEHLASCDVAMGVLRKMLQAAGKGVWLRMPSFEPDQTNTERLAPLGLKFTWTTWSGHPAHLTRQAVREVVERRDDWRLIFIPNMQVRDTSHPHIVPVSAPDNITLYQEDLGPKPRVTFDPPLIGQWEAIMARR